MDLARKRYMAFVLAGGTVVICLWLRSRLTSARQPRAEHSSRQNHHAQDPIHPPRSRAILSQINPEKSETDTDIDIVAIHGLDTKSPDTWTWVDRNNRENQVNWLQDPHMLPSKVERVRVFTYSWPADLMQPSDLVQKADEEFAVLLFEDIRIRLQSTSDRARVGDRPILFIASCLGGIILMKALVSTSETYNSVRRATRGIVFLATPFRGTSFQDMAALAEPGLKLWASIRGREVSNLLNNVKGSTFDLEALVRKFTRLCQDKEPPCHVFNFYEKGKTSLPSKVIPWLPLWLRQEKQLVDESSATLDIVPDPLPLSRPHSLMNKFSHSQCTHRCKDPCDERKDFELVSGKIQGILKEIREGSLLKQADDFIRDKHYTPETLKIERLSGDELPMDKCYINLAIEEQPSRGTGQFSVQPEKGNTPAKSSPFSLSARLKLEIPSQNVQVELPTLFNERKGSNGALIRPRRIVIRGRAGVGKTTLCKKMVHDFVYHPTWNELFDRILWVPLRTLKKKPDKGYNLEGLLLRDFFSNNPNRERLAKELEKELHATEFSRTLFILDGLDEVSDGWDTDSEMYKFLKFLLERPNVIITSRSSVRQLSDLHPDLQLETVGFHRDQVNKYIEKTFTDPGTGKADPRANEVQTFLQSRSLIQDLARIPIQLDAICYTWDSDLDSGSVPETMTPIYQAIEYRLWKKDILRLEKKSTGKSVIKSHIENASRAKIEGFVIDEISFLEHLAFTGLHNDTIDFGSVLRNHIADKFVPNLLLDETLPCLSFLRKSAPSSEDYHFLHLTYQEYFAARYFVQQWMSRERLKCLKLEIRQGPTRYHPEQYDTGTYLQKHKYNSRYDIFWRFVAGLFQTKGDSDQLCDFLNKIEHEPRDLLGPVHQRLVMHCLSEAVPSQETQTFNELREDRERRLKQWLLFECNFEFNRDGYSRLAAEMEFPEPILKVVIQEEAEDIQEKVLYSLLTRPIISPTLIKCAVSFLGQDVSNGLKKEALRVFERSSKALPEKLLQDVVALLKVPDWDVRRAAADALSQQSALPEQLLQDLAALLKDPDWFVRHAAVEALWQQSAMPEQLLQVMAAGLKDPAMGARLAAVEALGQQSALPEQLLQDMAALLKDPEPHILCAVIKALGQQSALSEKKVLQDVAALLKDPERNVRCAAAWALSQQSALPEQLLRDMAALLKDPEPCVLGAAIKALSQKSALPEKKLLQDVAALLKDPQPDVRRGAIEAVSQQSAMLEKLHQDVAALLKDPEPNIQYVAIDVLGQQSALPEKLLQDVAALLKDPDPYVRYGAVVIMSRQLALPEKLLQDVAALLKDPEASVRGAAVNFLGQQKALGQQSALPEEKLLQDVAAWLKDPQPCVRGAAMNVVSQQSALPEKLLQDVVALLKDPESDIQRVAIDVLGQQSALPEKLLQDVAALLKDPDWYARRGAIKALSGQSALSKKLLQDVAVLLRDPDGYIRLMAVRVLGQQSALPEEKLLQDVAALLKDPDDDIRCAAVTVLGQQLALLEERCYSFLLKMDSQSFNILYGEWLRKSFSDHLTWCVEGNHFSINMPEGGRNVPVDQLKRVIQDAHKFLRIPLS